MVFILVTLNCKTVSFRLFIIIAIGLRSSAGSTSPFCFALFFSFHHLGIGVALCLSLNYFSKPVFHARTRAVRTLALDCQQPTHWGLR
ncbi:hypothetical protein BDV30DRAFT_112626 [Aspergillus minisclerotigenes]|uniref:Uncharacterized protein n=1 Tax=Aspergillus minisclerotigenes TaxID=656917 RepID=A0A5N6J4Y1_9EURO|nr:hypothetical protein BDV30DRAFT_112626 [Aspergillus minisclerotigenes]